MEADGDQIDNVAETRLRVSFDVAEPLRPADANRVLSTPIGHSILFALPTVSIEADANI